MNSHSHYEGSLKEFQSRLPRD